MFSLLLGFLGFSGIPGGISAVAEAGISAIDGVFAVASFHANLFVIVASIFKFCTLQ
jgi:hypothetical protein